jgi:hypothetical protein
MDEWTTLISGAALAVLGALARYLIGWINRAVETGYLSQWHAGILAAAGRVLLAVLDAIAKDPAADKRALLMEAVRAEADRFMRAYARTANKIGGTRAEAESRLLGELGRMPELAALLAPAAELRELLPAEVSRWSEPYPIGTPMQAGWPLPPAPTAIADRLG